MVFPEIEEYGLGGKPQTCPCTHIIRAPVRRQTIGPDSRDHAPKEGPSVIVYNIFSDACDPRKRDVVLSVKISGYTPGLRILGNVWAQPVAKSYYEK